MSTTPNDFAEDERPAGSEGDASNDDVSPATETFGALVPPVRNPPTTIDASAEPPRGHRVGQSWRFEDWPRFVADAVTATLDAADRIGDAIASQLGLRRENS